MKWELNWSSLFYSLQLLSVLFISASVLYVMLMTLLISVGDACSAYDNRITRWLNRHYAAPRLRRQVRMTLPMVTMLMVGYVVGSAGIFNPIRELHDVEVSEKIAPRVYGVLVQGKPQVWRVCDDGDDLPLKAGMVMTVVQYEQGNGCQRFNNRTNVLYLRDAKHNVVDRQGNQLFGGDR